jgi:uncharacterized protein (TIGR02646 family)
MAMRPVDKGAAPSAYGRYQDAGPDLQARIGDYCSYCERQIETNLAIEHVQPKSLVPGLETDWSNFLLACVNCNSSKGNAVVNLTDYLWPDVDNTLGAFAYVRGGLVEARATLAPELHGKAQASIHLTGLDRNPGNPGREPSATDRRWLRRQQAWQKAEWCRQKLAEQDTVHTRELIVEVATGRGEFSIWWTVFAGDVDMRRRLRNAFLGTHAASFDANEDILARVGGQL